jgi:hypothetical protein
MMSKTKALIEEAVNAGLKAGRMQAAFVAKDAFKATERRLYALPFLEKKIAADREKLEEINAHGPKERSKSIVRFQRSGYRVDPEDMLEAIIKNLEATIEADEEEVAAVRRAMAPFENDPYFFAIIGKYINRYEDSDIAEELGCSGVQVWKQRTRIVKDISVMLYGSSAV